MSVKSKDEMGALCEGVNQMTEELSKITVSRNRLVSEIAEREKAEEENREIEKKLRQAQQLETVGRLAGGIAHEFNNLLAVIIGYGEVLLRKNEREGLKLPGIKEIYSAGTDAKNLVKQVLTFSRRKKQEFTYFELKNVVSEAVDMIQISFPSTLKIVKEINANGLFVFADETQMRQIITNLCTNARDALAEGFGEIRIVLDSCELNDKDISEKKMAMLTPGKYLKLSVLDTGMGIKDEIMGKIFEPFFTTKDTKKGTGLGLSVIHGIVTNLDGGIFVSSEEGVGTKVDVYFPQTKAPPSEGVKPAIKEDENLKKESGRLLYVDDEIEIIKMGKEMLENSGYKVTCTNSSNDALKMVKQAPNAFDAVITDQTMPELTGDQLAKKINKIRRNLPILLTTGYSSKINANNFKEAGMSGYLMKPFLAKDLTLAVKNILTK